MSDDERVQIGSYMKRNPLYISKKDVDGITLKGGRFMEETGDDECSRELHAKIKCTSICCCLKCPRVLMRTAIYFEQLFGTKQLLCYAAFANKNGPAAWDDAFPKDLHTYSFT